MQHMSSLPSSVDAAIIGAGAAGLGAANALKNSGLSSIVLEARDRIGGRGTRSRRRPASCSTSAAAGCIRQTRTPSLKSPNNWTSRSTEPCRLGASGRTGRHFRRRARRLHARARRILRARRGSRDEQRGQPRRSLSRARQSLESDDRCDLDLCERLRARPGLRPRHGCLRGHQHQLAGAARLRRADGGLRRASCRSRTIAK